IWVGGNRASGNELLQTGGGYRVEFNVAGRIGKGLWRCAFTEGGEGAYALAGVAGQGALTPH
ncbi:MAG: hypothetical protein WBC95_10075, partial [Albidovulum sp.]